VRILIRRDERIQRARQAAQAARAADRARVVDELKSVVGHTASVRRDPRRRIGRETWFRSSPRTNLTRT
jgi:hypothetical protein